MIITFIIKSFEQIKNLTLFGNAFAPEKIKNLKSNQVQLVKLFFALFLKPLLHNSYFCFIDIMRDLQEEVNQFIQLTANIRCNCTFQVSAILSNTDLFFTKMMLFRISDKLFHSQHDFHVITFSLDIFNFLIKDLFIFLDDFIKSIFYLTVEMHWFSIIIFELSV